MIVRLGKHKSDFTVLDNGFQRDKALGFAARGIIAYALTKPDSWKIRVATLAADSGDGEDRILSAMHQLRTAGYAKLSQIREGGRAAGTEWIISETPIFREPDFQETEKAETLKSRDSAFQETEKTGAIVSTIHLVNTDSKVNTECEARAKKSDGLKMKNQTVNSEFSASKSKTTLKGRAANDLLFSETVYSTNYDLWHSDLLNRETLPENLNLRHYYNLLKNWSQAQEVRRADWLAQTLYFINQDSANGKLKLTTTRTTGDQASDRINSALERAARLTRRNSEKAG